MEKFVGGTGCQPVGRRRWQGRWRSRHRRRRQRLPGTAMRHWCRNLLAGLHQSVEIELVGVALAVHLAHDVLVVVVPVVSDGFLIECVVFIGQSLFPWNSIFDLTISNGA